ncbi:MAG: hypothetical protein QGG40_01925 [Myxococcota bacterium]|jgi:hypothetical protein|nr:hypothetical protein [Myxococcota bacterium]
MWTWLLAIAALAAPQRVQVDVVVLWQAPQLELYAETDWLGETRRIRLEPGAGDLWSGHWEGGQVRTLDVSIYARARGMEEALLSRRSEVIVRADDRISYLIQASGRPEARRVATAAPEGRVESRQVAGLVAVLGWGVLVFLYVTWLIRQRGRGETG